MKAKMNGDEHDAFSRWRRHLSWKPGELKAIKSSFNRRIRREAKLAIAHITPERDGPEAAFMAPMYEASYAVVYANGEIRNAADSWHRWGSTVQFERYPY